jgi:tripartite ATP-independent transporter DctM subunit
MEWWFILLIIIASLILLFILGLPIAFSFLLIDLVGVFILWRGEAGLKQLVLNMFDSVALFSLVAVPMFVLMGEIMFRTGIGMKVFAALGKWLGRLPGRLSLLAVGSGALFSVLCGSSAATTALLGSLLVSDMKDKGYHPSMSVGPIIGSAGLAILIPPTTLGVLLASLAGIPVGKFLVAIVVPGILLAVLLCLYIVIRCTLQPQLAPAYDVKKYSFSEKMADTVKYILPLGVIVFLVLGLILLGIATPTQSAVLGAVGTIGLAAMYRKLNWEILWESLKETLKVSVMIFMIMVGSTTFSQILSFTGVTTELVKAVTEMDLQPFVLLAFIQVVLLFMGCFMEPMSIMMMTLPVLMPLAKAMEFDPIWFGVIMLVNMQVATFSPPFGMDLFAMKGVAPKDITMGQIYRAVLPFIVLNMFLMLLIMVFPQLALWLPGMVK